MTPKLEHEIFMHPPGHLP